MGVKLKSWHEMMVTKRKIRETVRQKKPTKTSQTSPFFNVFAFLSEMKALLCSCMFASKGMKGASHFYGYMNVWAWALTAARTKGSFFFTQSKVNRVERSIMGVLPGLHQHKLRDVRGPPSLCLRNTGWNLIAPHTSAHFIEAVKAAGRPPLSLANAAGGWRLDTSRVAQMRLQ